MEQQRPGDEGYESSKSAGEEIEFTPGTETAFGPHKDPRINPHTPDNKGVSEVLPSQRLTPSED